MKFHYLWRTVLLLSLLCGVKCNKEEIDNNIADKKVSYFSKDVRVTISEDINLEIIDHSKLAIDDNNKHAKPKLRGQLGVNIPRHLEPVITFNKEQLKLEWGPALSLEIKESEHPNCHNVLWISELNSSLEDCYHYDQLNWFGGPEIRQQYWPVENLHLRDLPYVTQMFGNIAKTESYWLNSKGAYIYVSKRTPLFIDSNNHEIGKICFIANDVAPYLKRPKKILEYSVCSLSDPRKAQEHAIKFFLGKPSRIPDIKMIQHPIWSTWVRYKLDVNETVTLKFAEDIVRYGFNNSQIEIDDNWESCYGSTKFNTSRFSNMKNLSDRLKRLGFRITIWTHPFVNVDCPDYYELKSKGYFVKNVDGNTETVWWDGNAGVVDFTNTEAVKWFKNRYRRLMRENGIDGLKFDAGETSWLPQIPVLNCSEDEHPQAYTTAYAETVSDLSPLTELRINYHTQKYPMFVRMLDKDSKWSFNNGLPTVITTMLVMNIQGYPWVLPDMIGGNAYDTDVVDKELFIRWLQVNVFMPSIQFSAAPWDFDYETIEISRKFTELHYKYSSKIIELMEKTVENGAPLNPPIWWVDPTNPTAHKIHSEYLLGEDILVAPILNKGAIKRDIYLPKGHWKDGNNPERVYRGRQWLKDYHADLSILPYFIRVHKPSFTNEDNNTSVEDESQFFSDS